MKAVCEALAWPAFDPTELGGERPILVLVGDACDHWSQQYAVDIAADDEVVELLSAGFACRWCDRRRWAGWAAQVQAVLGLVAQSSGWPAVVVLLPDGRPIGALPYAPVRDRDKRAGLVRVVIDLLQAWHDQPDTLSHDAEQLQAALRQLRPPRGTAPAAALTLDRAEAMAMELADPLEGGFGPAPRGLDAGLLGFLVDRCDRDDAPPSLRDQVERTCTALLAGAMHDHLGGGFFQRCEDAAWSRAFTAKTVRDNALAAQVLLPAARVFDTGLYRAAATAALDWCLGALRREDGWFDRGLHASSTGADGAPVPGAAYTWTEAAAADVVGREQARIFADRFLADERGRLDDDGWQLPAVRGQLTPEDNATLPAICRRLLVARSERPAPERIAEAWHGDQGCLLASLCLAGSLPDGERFQQAAEQLATALLRSEPCLYRWADGTAVGTADADALAWRAAGLAAWGRQQADAAALDAAESAVAALWAWRGAEGSIPCDATATSDALLDGEDGPAAAAVLVRALTDLEGAERMVPDDCVADLRGDAAAYIQQAPLAVAGLLVGWA